jgi:hypothetical protein
MPPHLLGLLQEGVEVRPWLERHLVGPDLLAVVGELAAVSGREADADAGGLLVAQRTEILEHGLASLTDEEVQVLFRNPALLLRLQEWVLVDGGPYWDGVLSGSANRVLVPPSPVPKLPARPGLSRLWAVASHAGIAAMAAALMWFLIVPRPPTEHPTAKEDIAAAPPDLLLSTLARQLDEKLSAARRGPDALAALQQMHDTCATLAAAPLPQLSDSARAAVRRDLSWLQTQIAAQRRILEQGAEVWQVRSTVESRVHSLVSTRWRDPVDLPDATQDPDDLPSEDTF